MDEPRVVLFLLMVVALVIYTLPTLNAALRKHHQINAIFVVNLFLGWTALGWIAALVWSMTAVQPVLSKDATKKCPA